MTPQQTAMVAAMELRFAEAFEHRGYEDPQAEAKRWISELLRAGWRPWPALADRAPPRAAAPSRVARQHLAEARQVLEEKRGRRPELDGGAR